MPGQVQDSLQDHSNLRHRLSHPVRLKSQPITCRFRWMMLQPEGLTRAEAAIEKHDYVLRRRLLQKVVASDAGSYVAWFDLGFVENELGHLDDSIAAYRKSVAAKPDVFESNLNLGVQLAKSGSPESEEFLHAATRVEADQQRGGRPIPGVDRAGPDDHQNEARGGACRIPEGGEAAAERNRASSRWRTHS